jgi:hypothetical protein
VSKNARKLGGTSAPVETNVLIFQTFDDIARTDFHRFMVTVAIDFTAESSDIVSKFQREVVEAIRDSISNGTFTKDY